VFDRSFSRISCRGSRIASELGGAIERIWGGFTSTNGDANALRTAYQLAEVTPEIRYPKPRNPKNKIQRALNQNLVAPCEQVVAPLLDGLDKDQPIIATHSLVGLTAVAAGFKNVVNLVIDNHPQWFLVVPGAHNLVQGPKSYARLLRLGVPESDVSIAGELITFRLHEFVAVPESNVRDPGKLPSIDSDPGERSNTKSPPIWPITCRTPVPQVIGCHPRS
jgi:hypothetical protein